MTETAVSMEDRRGVSATRKPLEVVHVVAPTMRRGGVQIWLMHVLRHIDRRRFHFTFCVQSPERGAFDDELRELGADVVLCSLDDGRRTFARRFESLLADLNCDVLHSHLLFFSGWLLKLAAKAGVPIRIAHAHSAADGRSSSPGRHAYRWFMRRCIRKYATHGIGCSAKAADFLFSPRWQAWTGFQVAPCAINPCDFHGSLDRASLCRELGIPPDASILGHVGRFRPAKNHSFLLRTFAALAHRRENVHLLLVGDGELRTDIHALACDLKVADRVTFAGERDDVPVLLRNVFDVFVFPSLYEGLGLAVVEAQCAGVPSLVSDTVPREGVIIDELVCWESLRAGPDAWADRLLSILQRPPYDRDRARQAVERSDFGIQSNVNFLSELYAGKPRTT